MKNTLVLLLFAYLCVYHHAAEATCTRGPRGPMGQVPGLTIVDGTEIPLTVAGVQSAIDARATAGNYGVVSLAGDITVSGTAIRLKSKVILDCNGYSIKAHPTATVTSDGLVSNIGASVAGNYNILVNATRGSRNISLSVSDAANFAKGDLMNIQGCRLPNYPQTAAAYHTFVVYSVDLVTGMVTLRNPLPFDCYVAGTVNVPLAARIRPIADTGVRNCVFDANGNSAATFHLLSSRFGLRYTAENLKFTGTLPINGVAFYCLDSADGVYKDFTSINLEIHFTTRDYDFQTCEGCLVENLRSSGPGGFGPRIVQWHDGIVRNVWAAVHDVRGFRTDGSYRNIINGVFTLGGVLPASGTGFYLSFASADNIVSNLVSVGNTGIGLAFSQTGDDRNQVTGYVAYANGGTDVGITSASTNNYIHGMYEWHNTAVADLTVQNHLVRIGGTRGLIAAEVKGIPFPQTADLRPYELTTTRVNDTHLVESYRGTDNAVRVFVKRFI
jgi:hypothetical protein